MKNLISILMLLSSITTIFSNDLPELQTFSNWEFGLSFTIPEGWKLNRGIPSYLAILNDPLELASFSVVAIILSEEKPFDEFRNIMETHIDLNGEKGMPLKDALVNQDYLIVEKSDMIRDQNGELKNPYELLLYDNEPDPEVIEHLIKEKVDEEDLPIQTIGTYIYDTLIDQNIPYRTIVIYSLVGNVGYAFVCSAPMELYMNYIPTFISLIKEIRPNLLSGGQYGISAQVETELENTGIISGRVLMEGMSVPGIKVKLYSTPEDYKRGKPIIEVQTNSVGEFWIMNVTPGHNMVIDAVGFIGTQKLRSWKPVKNISVEAGKVTFVNIEIE
ncbi:MAG: hypothetical protein DRH49_04745 [Candidatus Coatesbacteria bacterium]|nr:MAG: hypothetical protein DRH49_04745 [Candidatus Coatesbacteria bacterium]